MKKVSLVLLSSMLLATAAMSQSTYKSAIGVRVGVPVAASFKQFISPAGALEFHAGFWGYPNVYSYFSVGAMYQHHFPIGDVAGLKWYIGGGALMQFFSYKNYYTGSSAALGIHPVGGVDYKFSNIPLDVSADVMPTFIIGDVVYNFRGYGGVAARYTFR